jgi:molybdopterin converting factor small subunit
VTVTIELFGIPRQRAGIAQCQFAFDGDQVALGEVLARLAEQYPDFAADCIRSNRLAPGYVANLRGERFVSDPATILGDGDALLILSADAGG